MYIQLSKDNNFKELNLVEYRKTLHTRQGFRFEDTGYWIQTWWDGHPRERGPILWFYLNRENEESEIEKSEVTMSRLLNRSYCVSFSNGQFDNLPEGLQEFLIFNMNEFVDNHGEFSIPRS